MKTTMIITIETEGEHAYRTAEAAEDDLLSFCQVVTDCYRGCSVHPELCVIPLSDRLISDLCNAGGVYDMCIS